MFWILNSHQALATRSCVLTWAPWCKLPYAVPNPDPLLFFSLPPPFFPWSSLFFLCELFLQTVQCFSCCLLMRCQLDHFRPNHFVVMILVISHFFFIFGPLTDFYHLVLCFIIKHPFLFNLRSVDRVVFYEACSKTRWYLGKGEPFWLCNGGDIKKVNEYSLGPAE